jgi:predicted AlkP superfamily pyrophosphatase or phosphodiesterase
MINRNSLDSLANAAFSQQFIRPLYQSYCFSNIPQTIKNILIQEHKPALPEDVFMHRENDNEKVVLLLLDGFGWKFFTKYADNYPFLKRFIDIGCVSALTSQFPSTTPAELTTIHTGQPVGETGVYEWVYFEPKVDALISPLLFSFAGKRVRDTLKPTGIDPYVLFPNKNLYADLKMHNIPSYVFQSNEYANSPYAQVMFKEAEVFGFDSVDDGIT